METLNTDREIVEKVLLDYAQVKYAYGDIQTQTVLDRQRDHYLLMNLGWDLRRIHGCLIHVDLIDGKFWIQRNGTEGGKERRTADDAERRRSEPEQC